jgi:succinate dehydrogenase/fumarate reductase flavoprotein subunit
VRVYPGDIGTSLGLRTDPKARVLDTAEQRIEGLYACGNDMNSIMAGTYPSGGITLGPAMTFGYIIGSDLAHGTSLPSASAIPEERSHALAG